MQATGEAALRADRLQAGSYESAQALLVACTQAPANSHRSRAGALLQKAPGMLLQKNKQARAYEKNPCTSASTRVRGMGGRLLRNTRP